MDTDVVWEYSKTYFEKAKEIFTRNSVILAVT